MTAEKQKNENSAEEIVKKEQIQKKSSVKSSSLYVGDLAPTVTEDMLFKLFSKSVTVSSVKICVDSDTQRSLGYGYANFHTIAEAEKALKHLNFSRLEGREIRLMWKQTDKTARSSGIGNIIVTNLEENIDNKTFFDTFSIFGKILSTRVATDSMGFSKCFGFVQFEKAEDALDAIKKVNGNTICGKPVKVMQFKPRAARPTAKSIFTNVYVKNFTQDLFPTENSFMKFFKGYGEVTSVMMPTDETGKPMGFGFVNFKSPSIAQKVVETLHDAEPEHLYVTRALSKSQRRRQLQAGYELWRREIDTKTSGRNVFVKNLPESVEEEQLRREFEFFGPIQSIKVEREPSGRSRCFGYILFSNGENALESIKVMNKKVWGGKVMNVCLWQRKEVRMRSPRRQTQSVPQIPYEQNYIFPPVYPQQLYQPMYYQSNMAGRIVGAHNNIHPNAHEIAPYLRPGVWRPEDVMTSKMDSPTQEEEEENTVGEELFQRLQPIYPQYASKITGMFLESSAEERYRILRDENYFLSMAKQAAELLSAKSERQ